ncbi:hypothetical protein CQ12_14230 [Bradyrhizobium jicamae]|uniref:Uncharacterized protein n=2 Tax=Bradyrhizobium TaxID=374 RepID=A0A0R3LP43_9BRAD|nr:MULTISPECIES: hypothetical protein [Bradyrhizobium]KRR09633.1 hypothetical protein CQ12_14230 [Bradyrhizobium jicamae]KRR16553.1 hypothetical protein CQ14_30465 [Bradyrhizobium lablabi]
MIGNVIAFVRFAPFAIFLFIAIVGAFAALIGGLAGWSDVTEFGKLAAGGGALGFFAWLCLPALIRAL